MKEKLESVAGNDKWQVKNSLDGKYKPRLAKEIVKDALASVGKVRKYNLKESNCEHFANEMRYGVAVSQQVGWTASVIFTGLIEHKHKMTILWFQM